LAPAVMLLRALEYAARAGELTKNYFKLTDTQAFEYLLNKCNNQTKTIVEDIHRWRFYTLVYEAATGKPNKTIHRLDSNISALTDLTDSICYDLGIKPEKIAVYIRKGKEFKTINLPLIDEFGKLSRYVSEAKPVWRVHVLVHPEVAEKKKNLENTLVHYFI